MVDKINSFYRLLLLRARNFIHEQYSSMLFLFLVGSKIIRQASYHTFYQRSRLVQAEGYSRREPLA